MAPMISPDELFYGSTHKYEMAGRRVYVTVNLNEADQLKEVFINVGRSTDEERTVADIIGRLISLNLKYGAPVADIVALLSGHTDGVRALDGGKGYVGTVWEVVARTLQANVDAKPGGGQVQHVCPDCGSTVMPLGDHCVCYACGYATTD